MNFERTGRNLQEELTKLFGELQNLLQKSRWDRMPIDRIHGFLTAIAVGPRNLMPSDWIPQLFDDGSQGLTFKDEQEAQKIIDIIMNVYNGIQQSLAEGIFSPLMSFTKTNGNEALESQSWCLGFLFGVGAFEPSDWDIDKEPKLAELCLPIFYQTKSEEIKAFYTVKQLERMAALGEKSGESITKSVYELKEFFQDDDLPQELIPKQRSMLKIGRNEPCPCGSGKKFKKCCDANN